MLVVRAGFLSSDEPLWLPGFLIQVQQFMDIQDFYLETGGHLGQWGFLCLLENQDAVPLSIYSLEGHTVGITGADKSP